MICFILAAPTGIPHRIVLIGGLSKRPLREKQDEAVLHPNRPVFLTSI